MKFRIAIIDVFGPIYTGDTLEKRGLGGCEASVIQISRELAKMGYKIYVFNACEKEGRYNDVLYKKLEEVERYSNFDIVISVRSIVPFLHNSTIEQYTRGFVLPDFSKIVETAHYKILWKLDTFVDGDLLISNLLKYRKIDKVFTLSDWHTQHTCKHLNIHMEDIWQTRCGYTYYPTNLSDILDKDKDAFVYNAAAYKGLKLLLEKIWPEVKKKIPEAHLTVIGGWYDGIEDDNWGQLQEYMGSDYYSKELNVSYTGIITPKEVANILAKSTFFLYPCIFPETFGISTLEAQKYMCLPITTNEGALQTTALDKTSYKIDAVFGFVEDFIDLTINAHEDKDTIYFKQFYCKEMKGNTWDNIAEEWSNFFQEQLYPDQPLYTLGERLPTITPPIVDFREELKVKSILIAIPTAVRIECETFKSIYDLKIPDGYKVDFNFFWNYMVDQGRNMIASYAIQNNYDYVLCIDSDIEVPQDALEKMLAHDKDYVCGMYRMRRPEQHIEVYDIGYRLLPPTLLKEVDGLLEIGGSGFGCVLVKTSLFAAVGYPQFFYHQAYEYHNIFSEDNDFCKKARDLGYKLYCDTSIRCRHKGTVMWEIKYE